MEKAELHIQNEYICKAPIQNGSEKMRLSHYENEIKRTKLEILELEKNVQQNIEHLGNRFKELGDLYSDYFRCLYICENKIDPSLHNSSCSNYDQASNLFLKNRLDEKYIYSLMAWGNAYKESFLPPMERNDFSPLYNKAKEKYLQGIDHHFESGRLFPNEYQFLMLEQLNLEIRKRVWQSGLLPKRVNIFHSLKSPISHAALEGLCYYSYLNCFEIWEYRYGQVRTFDKEKKFIKDRLNETSAVIFLLSEDYSTNRDIVKFEVEEVCKMVKTNDPLQVFGVDLGNHELAEKLSNDIKDFKTYKIADIPKIFEENSKNIKDIYECRKFRIKDAN